jgi:hypothetical protein
LGINTTLFDLVNEGMCVIIFIKFGVIILWS